MQNTISKNHEDAGIRSLYLMGGITCMIFIAYSLATILIVIMIGTPPENIEACYRMLNENRLHGLLRMDILTVFVMPLYYLLFFSLYLALKDTHKELLALSTIMVFAGVTLFLAAPSVFSYLHLSDEYVHVSSEIEKSRLIAAGQAILASDIWHGTGAKIGGLLTQTGALLISVIMLKGRVFNKLTAYTGIVTHGLDLLHIILGFFLTSAGAMLMVIAGPLYLVWIPLVGLRLLRLSKP